MVLGRGLSGWRRNGGPILRPELVGLWLVVSVGSRNWGAGGGWAVVLGTAALAAVAAAPGPLRPTAGTWTANGAAVWLWQWVWAPAWEALIGDRIGSLAAPLLLGVAAGAAGRWMDRVWWPRAIAERRRRAIDQGCPLDVPGLFLYVDYGRWWGRAECELPLHLYLVDGSVVHLRPGQRYIWRRLDGPRGLDMAKTTAGPGPEAAFS